MADTARSLPELQSLLADNELGNISAQDLRDMLVSVLGCYGSISVTGGTTAQGSLGTTPVKLTPFDTDGDADNMTPDSANDQIQVALAGKYLVNLELSYSGTASTTFVTGISINGAPTAFKAERAVDSGGNIGHVSVAAILDLAAGDVVAANVALLAPGAETITVKHGALVLSRLQ
jgi:hypothetical protein